MIASTLPFDGTSDAQLRTGFLALLPRFLRHARIYFRDERPDRREENVAETLALAWSWYRRLAERGKDAAQFPMAFIVLAARSVASGRKAAGMEKSKDVMNPHAQRRYGFRVEALPATTRTGFETLLAEPRGQRLLDAFEERLHEDDVMPVPDQVAFRLDWPEYFGTLSERDRRLAEFLSLGHRATDAADRFKLSPGRVTQLRQQWCREWQAFQGDAVTNPEGRLQPA
jgi:hypothetical protein